MVPGPGGEDSPPLDLGGAAQWGRWLRIADDRAAGRPSGLLLLSDATGVAIEGPFGMLWHRWQTGGILTHRATFVETEHDTFTLVSACGLSRPWNGWAIDVDPADKPDPMTVCTRCEARSRR